MTGRHLRTALFATLAAAAGLAGAYATAGWTGSFVALPIDDLIIELTPAGIVNFMIENVGEEAHYLHQLGALGIAGGLYAVVAAAGLETARAFEHGPAGALVATLAAGVSTYLIAGAAVPAVAAGASLGAVVAVGTAVAPADREFDPTDGDRREAVGTIAGTAAYAGMALFFGDRATREAREVSAGLDLEGTETEGASRTTGDGATTSETETETEAETDAGDEPSEVERLLQRAEETALDVEGVQSPVSEYGDFYQIDINSAPPEVEADDWELTIRGAVEEEVAIDYDDLREREVEHRFVALRCIGEDLNEHKLDTALWTGTSIEPLLEEASPESEFVELHSADGYVSTFPREFLEGGMIAYGMNGEVLPRDHGFPARILMPGTWGKVNNKWVTDVVFVEEDTDGYWEERGWDSEAPMKAVAKLWTGEPGDRANRLDDGRLEIGGHAYAGTRGVDRVEVSTDGGETWDEAELAEPLPGEDVTRQWRYRYEADGPHEVVARVVDGEGNVQTREASSSYPDGATGWVSATIDP